MLFNLGKVHRYLTNYILVFKWIRTLLIPALAILLAANYLEIMALKKMMTFSKAATPKDATDKVLYQIGIFILIYTTLKYLVNIFSVYLISFSSRKAYVDFFSEFLHITFPEFNKHSVGVKQYSIQRRAVGLSMFFQTLTIHFMVNFVFFTWIVIEVCTKLSLLASLKILGAILIYMLCVGILQATRSTIRKKCNMGYEKNGKKMYDILLNYERIVAYNNLNIELNKYHKEMRMQVYYSRIFWISYEFGNFLTDALFVLLTLFIFTEYQTANIGTKDEIVTKVVQLSGLIKKLESRIKMLSRDVAALMTWFVNFDQSIIENAQREENETKIKVKTFEDSIVANDMGFAHSQREIFDHVFAKLLKGKSIAITGTNGCGKSTFLKIILGFYEYKGTLELDGWEYKTIDSKCIRELISYVPQDSQLFDSTIIENLKVGNSEITQEAIYELCMKYNYHDLFKKLGYDMRIGSRGNKISGGERQKIAFMRAIIKDAPILILDEPTSALDKKSEEVMIDQIVTNSDKKTVLMIVHNLEMLQKFDEVMFFTEGTLNSSGSFNELYENNQVFHNFYKVSTEKQRA